MLDEITYQEDGNLFSFDDSYYNKMKVFITSLCDTAKELQIANDAIEVDRVCNNTLGLHAECLRWEDLFPLTPNPDEGHMQGNIGFPK